MQNRPELTIIQCDMVIIDSLDEKLIQLLGKDGRQSSKELSKQLAVSAGTVRRRLRRLIKSRVLRITALVSAEEMGLPLAAIVALDVAPENLNSVTKFLTGFRIVRWVAVVTGRFDLLVWLRLPSTKELFAFIQSELPKIEGIRNVETFVCLQTNRDYVQV